MDIEYSTISLSFREKIHAELEADTPLMLAHAILHLGREGIPPASTERRAYIFGIRFRTLLARDGCYCRFLYVYLNDSQQASIL